MLVSNKTNTTHTHTLKCSFFFQTNVTAFILENRGNIPTGQKLHNHTPKIIAENQRLSKHFNQYISN